MATTRYVVIADCWLPDKRTKVPVAFGTFHNKDRAEELRQRCQGYGHLSSARVLILNDTDAGSLRNPRIF